MKFVLSFLVYLLLPLPPILIYIFTGAIYWEGLDIYSGSSLLGIAAFTWFSTQLLLASKPFGLDKLLGLKPLMALHGLGALLALAAVHGHWYMKMFLQGNEMTLQPLLGLLAMYIFLGVTIVAMIFMGNHFPAPAKALKKFRTWVQTKWGWTYKGLRLFHNLSILALILMGIHVLMAFSTQQSLWTVVYMSLWLTANVGLYLRYRIRNRK